MNITPEMMTTIAIVVGVILVLGVLAWLFMRSRNRHTTVAPQHREHERNVIHSQVDHLNEKHELVDSRLERHDRLVDDLNSRIAALQTENDARGRMIQTMERSVKDLQEQIYELRQEHKILMQREDRQERDVHDLQARIIGVSEGHYGDGHHGDSSNIRRF